MLEENQVEIEDVAPVVEEEFSIEGLMPEEIEMAKEFDLIKEKEDGVDDEQSEDATETDSEEQEEEEINTDPDNFDDMDKVLEKDEKKFHEKYTPNQKALYFKQKAFKKKFQDSKKEAEELRKQLDELKGASTSKSKLDKVAELLNSGEDLTIERLQAVINEDVKSTVEKDEPITQEAVMARVQEKANFAEKIGRAKYDNFEEISKLAGELAKENKTYQKVLDDAFINDDIDEAELAETVVRIAKLSPKFDEVSGRKPELKVDPKADRVIKNSKKKVSSAAIGGSGKRLISESDLTCDQAVKLTPDQFAKLKPETQKRILMGIDP